MSDIDALCHTLRAFAEWIKGERDQQVGAVGEAGAFIAVARAKVADELIALLPPEEPRP